MVRQRGDIEQTKFELLHAIRQAVNLRYRLKAIRELNRVLPAAEAEFDNAVNRGVLPEIAANEVLGGQLAQERYVEDA